MEPFKISRRQFMGQASCAAVGSTALGSTLLNLLLTSSASAQAASVATDYRAIICLFLPGGNDSFNLLVPRGPSEYAAYASIRGDLALPRESLLPINPLNNPGQTLGLNPAAAELQQLFESEKLGFVANVGSLVQPTTLSNFKNRIGLPLGLFSHSDQKEQWQTSIPDQRGRAGWGGRMADLLHPTNQDSPISMNISIAGNNIFQVGQNVVPYVIDEYGALKLRGYKDGSSLGVIRGEAIDSLMAQEYSNALESAYNRMRRNSSDAYELFQDATAIGLPAGVTFPDNSLGRSFSQIAKIIAGRDVLGVKRQVFYLQWGGWDFHDNVLDNHAKMLPILSQAIKAFYDATVAMGISEGVTMFTGSDFGRTLTSNGKGSDHAWGGNHIVMGGAVRGKRIYGQYPDLTTGSPLDTGRGRLIPTTSVDEYAAELALWMGVDRSMIDRILPNIDRFYDVRGGGAPIGFLV